MDCERVKLETNGGGGGGVKLQLPVGYRFHPTDEELVVHYLKRKVHGLPLPASIIPDHNSTSHILLHPPGEEGNQKRYFFCNTDSYRVESGCGYWKAIGKEKPIVVATSNNYCDEQLGLVVVGVRKTLFLCCNLQRNKKKKKKKKKSNHRHYHNQHQGGRYGSTRWFMHEYRLVDSREVLGGNNWVLCSVFQKRRRRMMSKKRRVLSPLSDSSSVSCSSEVTTDDLEVCSK